MLLGNVAEGVETTEREEIREYANILFPKSIKGGADLSPTILSISLLSTTIVINPKRL